MTPTASIIPDDPELFPTLSLAERDRRWAILRRFLDDRGLAALVVFGGGRDKLDRYITKEAIAAAVVFPRHGDPTLIARFNAMPLLRLDEPGRQTERWVEDLRHGPAPELIRDVLRSVGAEREKVGIVGLTGYAPGNLTIPYHRWLKMLEVLPDVKWQDVSIDYEKLFFVKSPEELRLVRRAAQLGEDASRAFLEAAREGALESQVGAAATYAIVSQGGHEVPPNMLLRSGKQWLIGPPEWGYSGVQPHRLRRGDVIGSELFACYGGYETQQQMHVVIGEPNARQLRQAEAARAANDAGAAASKPGALFSDVYKVMHEVIADYGYWTRGPLTQTVGPVFVNSPMILGTETQPALQGLPIPAYTPAEDDFVIEAGMTLGMQACANEGLYGMCLGGTLLIGPDGAEELNTLARDLQVSA